MNPNNTHFLYPAALFASGEPYLINTILGSCVAVCLYDPVNQAGGMAHYMLPLWNGEGLASPKYGNIAVEKLVDKMKSYGSLQHNLKAKVFGGGEVIDIQDAYFYIGRRNIKMAYDMLEEFGIPVVGASTGGKYGRKLIFNTYTGQVKQRYVKRQDVP
jgi:chemotaxis protein CheD